MRDDAALLSEVNASGFPLQLGIARIVNYKSAEHNWSVRYVEHRWKGEGGSGGFVDLVLSWQGGVAHIVVECKRPQDTEWIFLRERGREDVTRTKAFLCANGAMVGWGDVHANMSSAESAFCVTVGQGDADRPMLERICFPLIEAVEAIANEDDTYLENADNRVYFPAVVTTASLKICDVDASSIDLRDGKIPLGAFSDAKFIRFRKQLAGKPSALSLKRFRHQQNFVADAKETTVYVINARQVTHFLRYLDIDGPSCPRRRTA